MGKLAYNFEFTVLQPIFLWLLAVLVAALRGYFRPYDVLYQRGMAKGERGNGIPSESERRDYKLKAGASIWFSLVGLVLVACAIWLTGDRWKVELAFQMWSCLRIIGVLAFFFALVMAWHFAETHQVGWLIVCLLAMLLIAAGNEHFFHQTANTKRIVCPHCSDENQ